MQIVSGGMTACPDDDLYIDMNIYGSAAVSSVAEYPANIAAVSGSAPRSRRLHLSVARPVALAQKPPQKGIGYEQQ